MATIPSGFVERRDTSDFLHLCGPFYERRENGHLISLALHIQEKHRNLRGISHGGLLMTMADSVLGDVVSEHYGSDIGLVTASMSSEFLRPVRCGDWVIGQASILKSGKRLAFTEATLSVNDQAVFRANGIFAIVEPMERR